MTTSRFKFASLFFGLLFILTLFITSCSLFDEEVTGSGEQSVTLSGDEFNCESGSGNIVYTGNVGKEWSAEIVEGDDFVSFSISGNQPTKSGKVISSGNNVLYFYLSKNNTTSDRIARINFAFKGESAVELTFAQLSPISSDGPYKITETSTTPRWAEIPTYDDNNSYIYVTHFSPNANNPSARNFSLCYDIENRAAAWVAYPYHSAYDGGVGRCEDWTYDPKIPTAYQPTLFSGYNNGTTYNRGHQIASGDRQAKVKMNEQTFYFTNMTPQYGKFNQGVWASLESRVRSQVCADTLFVVTGADYTTTQGSTADNYGNKCPIPGAYYKVMLRTKAGNTGKAVSECSADELMAIGYWMDHRNSNYTLPAPVSVSEIEEKTGFTFFPNIPDEVKESDYWAF